jgi:hypothetical protein
VSVVSVGTSVGTSGTINDSAMMMVVLWVSRCGPLRMRDILAGRSRFALLDT